MVNCWNLLFNKLRPYTSKRYSESGKNQYNPESNFNNCCLIINPKVVIRKKYKDLIEDWKG